MLLHGPFSSKNSINNYKLKNISFRNKFCNKTKLLNFIVPTCWNTVVIFNKHLNNHQIFLYSKNYFIKIIILETKPVIYYDFNTNQLFVNLLFISNYRHFYEKIISVFQNNLTKPIFTKIKFKGKGYYIYKNYRNTITPQFGYSHRLYLYSFYTHVKFLNKTTLICFGLNINSVENISSTLFNWRPVNIFTGRGVRFAKQLIYKKSGKISSYR